jgi:hypothetical protein
VFSLETKPAYVALSYAWTKERPTQQILLNSSLFYIRPNLYEFLKQMMVEQLTSWMFIDAICINQGDGVETINQMLLMASLYGGAEKVFAWVGARIEPPATMTVDFEGLMPRFENLFGQHVTEDGQVIEVPMADFEVVKLVLTLFFPSSFWSRLWIAQEIILARSLTIRFRGFAMTPEVALDFVEQCTNEGQMITGVHPKLTHRTGNITASNPVASAIVAHYLLSHRKDFQKKPDDRKKVMPLATAVSTISGQSCTKKYDKVFGLLGLTASSLVPSYSIPVVELYLRVLIEGLLLPPAGSDSRMLRLSLGVFVRALLLSLDMSPYDPLVAFLTIQSFAVTGYDFVDYRFYWRMANIYNFSFRPKLWLQYSLLRLRLNRWIGSSKFKSPGDARESLALEEWYRIVKDIYHDIKARLGLPSVSELLGIDERAIALYTQLVQCRRT